MMKRRSWISPRGGGYRPKNVSSGETKDLKPPKGGAVPPRDGYPSSCDVISQLPPVPGGPAPGAKPRSAGEFLSSPSQPHECPLPIGSNFLRGTVWRCLDCRKRYTWKFVDDSLGGHTRWVRRIWPWPR